MSEKIKLLVVEDNEADFRLVSEYVKESSQSFEVTHSHTLSEAIKAIAKNSFAAALLDLGLPDSQGLSIIDDISKADPKIAIIVLTGLKDDKVGVDALHKGAQDYLAKGGLQSELLVRSIHYSIERKNTERLLQKSHDELEAKVLSRTQELVTMNKQLTQEIVKRKESELQLSVRNMLLKLLNKTASRKAYLDGVIKLIKGWSKCRYIGIRVLDEEGMIPYESYTGFDGDFFSLESRLSIKTDNCLCIRVIKGRPDSAEKNFMSKAGSFFCNDTASLSKIISRQKGHKFRGTCLKKGFRSLSIIPIRHRDKIIGAIQLADDLPKKIDTGLREFMEGIAGFIGEGIHKFNLEDKIHKEHTMLDAFFYHSVSPIIFMDRDFNFIRVNKAFASAFKRDISEFSGHNYFDLYPNPENKAIFVSVAETKVAYKTLAKPFEFPGHPEWGISYWDQTLVPIFDEGGEVFLLVFLLNDVTERKLQEEKLNAAQRELEQARRLSDIGALAATVAHELRNPLAAINMASFNIRRKAKNPELDRHLDNIEKKVSESEQIITNLLFYSRIKPPHYETVDICEIINECLRDKKALLGKDISFEVQRKPDTNILIKADPLQMRELFSNIINNSCDALIGKIGKIEVVILGKGDKVKISISDNGCGIDKEHMSRVFDPFFTTKAKGTGLGLAVCQQIVNLHEGSISIESQVNIGTTVTLTLPKKE